MDIQILLEITRRVKARFSKDYPDSTINASVAVYDDDSWGVQVLIDGVDHEITNGAKTSELTGYLESLRK